MGRRCATFEGRITFVQESRFQPIDDDGIGHLFMLGPHAAAEPASSRRSRRAQARVRVS